VPREGRFSPRSACLGGTAGTKFGFLTCRPQMTSGVSDTASSDFDLMLYGRECLATQRTVASGGVKAQFAWRELASQSG
jgi:hypothetical protein